MCGSRCISAGRHCCPVSGNSDAPSSSCDTLLLGRVAACVNPLQSSCLFPQVSLVFVLNAPLDFRGTPIPRGTLSSGAPWSPASHVSQSSPSPSLPGLCIAAPAVVPSSQCAALVLKPGSVFLDSRDHLNLFASWSVFLFKRRESKSCPCHLPQITTVPHLPLPYKERLWSI